MALSGGLKMKWIEPNNGDVKTKVRFLWWPKKIGRVTKWLEFAEWEKRYNGFDETWIIVKWIEPPIENDPNN